MNECADKSLMQSKKANMGIIGIASVIGTGVLAVGAGVVSGPVAFPMVLEALKWIVGTYLVAQGGQDAVTAFKAKPDTQEPPK